jgi:hypothetical protein
MVVRKLTGPPSVNLAVAVGSGKPVDLSSVALPKVLTSGFIQPCIPMILDGGNRVGIHRRSYLAPILTFKLTGKRTLRSLAVYFAQSVSLPWSPETSEAFSI